MDEGFPDSDVDGLADCVDPDDDNDGVQDSQDCAPTDPAIHPGRPELCNGMDDDCDGVADGELADVLCQDDDSCTADLCDLEFGGCRHIPKCAGCPDHVPAGAVVITELLSTAEIPVYEWIEVENVCDGPVELDGWTLVGDSTGSHTIDNCGPLTLHVGKRRVLGRNMPATLGPPDNFDYVYTDVALRKDSGVSLVASDGAVIDHVPYGAPGFKKSVSRSLSLSADATDSALNDLPENWCVGISSGTFPFLWESRGEKNPLCDFTSECGNKVVEPGEDCDFGAKNGNSSCNSDCQWKAVCGDWWVEPPEQCDKGNLSHSGCCQSCQKMLCLDSFLPHCGDGVKQEWDPAANPPENPECCDDGNWLHGDGCSPFCDCEYYSGYPAFNCGDGKHDPLEECDDGNLLAGDGCSPECTWECNGSFPVGQLIFTEFSPYPLNNKATWFEIYNTGDGAVDLSGWFLCEMDDTKCIYMHRIVSTSPVVVNKLSYFIFTNNAASLAQLGIIAQYEYNGLWVANSLRSPDGTEIDSFLLKPYPKKGVSFSLAPSSLNYMANDLVANWCSSSVPMGNGDHGTPGQPNPECP